MSDPKSPTKPPAPRAFGISTRRFSTLGIHPQLITVNKTNRLGPGQYDAHRFHCRYKNTSSWSKKRETEEFSQFLGFFNPCLLKERRFRATLGGPGTYDLIEWQPQMGGASRLQDVGFGREVRFKSFLKDDQPPPGSHNIKRPKKRFNSTPTFEFDGIQPRFRNTEPEYRKAPNRYDIAKDTLLKPSVSKRGPYDTFTGPRDATTIKNHFAPAAFKSPDKFYVIPSQMDQLLRHPRKKRCGKFLRADRFSEYATITASKNGFTMLTYAEDFPGPAHYEIPGGIRELPEGLRPFNSSKKHARPPTDWSIHPGPERYEVKMPTCHLKKPIKNSWMFLSQYNRDLVKVESYCNFVYD